MHPDRRHLVEARSHSRVQAVTLFLVLPAGHVKLMVLGTVQLHYATVCLFLPNLRLLVYCMFYIVGRPCNILTTLVDGSKVGNGHVFEDVVRFSCNSGFELFGSDVRQCQADGTWNGSLTNCSGKMQCWLI